MEAVRCLKCGETRWTLFRAQVKRPPNRPCEACGGPTVIERRHPGASPRPPFTERRDSTPPSGLART
jgi:hypothetical protein